MKLVSTRSMGLFKIVVAGMLFLMQGCYSSQLNYEWEWTTRKITGTVLGESGEAFSQPGFILVRSYYSQFVELEEGQPVYFPQARLFFIGEEGHFRVPFDFKAAKIDLTFVTPGYVMHSLSFQRQLGIGDLSYEIEMKKTAGWQDHFFVTVMPFLQQFILEQRFQLAQTHQLFLGEWITKQKTKNMPGAEKPGS